MLSYLADYEHIFGPLRLFRYITFRGFMAAAMAFSMGFVVAPWLFAKLRALKVAQVLRDKTQVRELADLHRGKKNTPTMGGLMIYICVTSSVLLWAEPNIYVWVALWVYTALTGVGFADDYLKVTKKNSKGLSGRAKLLFQGIITGVVVILFLSHPDSASTMRELWVPFYKSFLIEEMPIWLLAGLLFLVLAGSSNAINLTDGVDGLAIGCTVSVACVYAIMAYAAGKCFGV